MEAKTIPPLIAVEDAKLKLYEKNKDKCAVFMRRMGNYCYICSLIVTNYKR